MYSLTKFDQIRGLRVGDALTQMKFSKKRQAKTVKDVLQNAINLADINHGIEPEDLVAFVLQFCLITISKTVFDSWLVRHLLGKAYI